MSEKSTHEFKIRLDDSDTTADHDDVAKPAPPKADAVRKKRTQKLERNSSWISYALIFAAIAATIIGYSDIRNRLLNVHSTGSKETQHLSEDLQSKFSSLGIKLSNLESTLSSLSESQTELTDTVSSLNDELSKTNKSVSGITSSKADKKSVTSSVAKVEKELSSLSESLKKNSADTAVLSAKLTATLTALDNASARTSGDLNALKAAVDAMQTDMASKKDLLAEIDHIENVLNTNQANIDKQRAAILQSIQRLDMRTNAIEVKLGLTTSSGVSETASPPPVSATGETPSESPSTSNLEPGGLIERDLPQ